MAWPWWAGTASAEEVIVGLITKTNNNPFFVKMKEGAEAKAKELGVELRSFAGKYDGDNEGQVAVVGTKFFHPFNLSLILQQVTIIGTVGIAADPDHPDRRHRPVGRCDHGPVPRW